MNEKDLINQEATTAEESELNKPITFSLLMKFALPTIFAVVVMGTFNIVDGVFAMRVLGDGAMSAISAIQPFMMIVMSLCAMLAGGATVVVLKKIGMKRNHEARQNFTLITIVAFVLALGITIWAFLFPNFLLELLGVNYEFIALSRQYLRIVVWSLPLLALGMLFNQFIIADGKPMLGMGISLLGSVFSAGLNAIFLFGFGWGIESLAWASIIGTSLQPTILFFVFRNNRKGTIYFAAPTFDIGAIGRSVLNGTGAAIPLISVAVVTIVMNNVLVRMDGVGALGIAVAGMIMGLMQVISMMFNGYMQGTMPLVSYNYGKGDHNRLKRLFKWHLKIIAVITVITLSGAVIFANQIMRIYFPAEAVGTFMFDMAVRGLRISAIALIVSGFNGLISGMFAAVNKGAVAGLLSAVRAFGFNLPLLLLLPRALDLDGVWLATPIADGMTIIIAVILVLALGKRYNFTGRERAAND